MQYFIFPSYLNLSPRNMHVCCFISLLNMSGFQMIPYYIGNDRCRPFNTLYFQASWTFGPAIFMFIAFFVLLKIGGFSWYRIALDMNIICSSLNTWYFQAPWTFDPCRTPAIFILIALFCCWKRWFEIVPSYLIIPQRICF